MPERRLAAARRTLPAGYQFGDGKWGVDLSTAIRANPVLMGRRPLTTEECDAMRAAWHRTYSDASPYVICPTCGVAIVERGSSCPACHCGVI